MNRKLLAGLFAFVMAAAGCGTDAGDTNANAINADVAANVQSAEPDAPAEPTMSPTESLRALSEASNAQDVEKIKSFLSANTLAALEEAARRRNTTVDALLLQPDGAPFMTLPPIRGEEIMGTRATVEVQNMDTKRFEKLPLVNENGMWRVAIDEYLRDIEELDDIP